MRQHVEDLWPAGIDQGSPEWIASNVDGILATIERLYAVAVETDALGAIEFLSWLPKLLVELDQGQTLNG